MKSESVTFEATMQTRFLRCIGTVPTSLLAVSIATQTMKHIKNGQLIAHYTISTSKYGIGNTENSFKTPLGIHQIVEKIGAGAPVGAIFRDRIFTGVVWSPEVGTEEENSILTRILRLKGLEPGINQGPGIDTYERYVYIHGTNKENNLGTPFSHGCVCMSNGDIIQLFDAVDEGSIVLIER
ncbi:MAG: L,D-transpeptidase [Chitinivibrionales bacterium]|nr:L,D-transpeptidase [Chitinivibrionales bacterium]